MLAAVSIIGLVACLGPDRAEAARAKCEPGLRGLAHSAGLKYPFQTVFLRAFKAEKRLELWAGDKGGKLKLVRAYDVLAASGGPGPKRREGDGQVPEGFYSIDRFNPVSRFHLSMRVSFPGPSDKLLGDKARPGGDIYIHGSNLSIGCLAIGDHAIEELYTACRDCPASHAGGIHILILPFIERGEIPRQPADVERLWRDLSRINKAFGKSNSVPHVSVDPSGSYATQD